MSKAKKDDDVVKPLDNHASAVEENVTDATKDQASEGKITTLDNHASGGETTPQDNHASDETA
ncbi:hypothetical protein ABT063_06110 [Streptomyces sp. NPDC002838]|uniref:hypothetical protein n=1 Tax=Streptomyces sp. NPDC002838 TaxID=3154436 RepID=UPI003333E921